MWDCASEEEEGQEDLIDDVGKAQHQTGREWTAETNSLRSPPHYMISMKAHVYAGTHKPTYTHTHSLTLSPWGGDLQGSSAPLWAVESNFVLISSNFSPVRCFRFYFTASETCGVLAAAPPKYLWVLYSYLANLYICWCCLINRRMYILFLLYWLW